GIGFFTNDGKSVGAVELEPDASGLVQTVFRIVSLEDGSEVYRFTSPPQAIDPSEGGPGEWTYIDRNDPARNVYAMDYSSGGSARKITHFTDGRLTDHEWSPDLRRIAVVRHDDNGENLWVVNADGSAPKQITKFDGEDIVEFDWTLDSKRVVVRAGTQSRDVVLISNLR
ncbi:MAG TPA: hypothetical protein VEC56_09315, partial [Candidatus Krumholzibacteria bacterium]|nr:hypothetical protein [Candidatus Krumholzibacteria bacterium]